MTKRRVSLKDIASQLGVSVSTVSRALKDHPDLSPAIIEKVKQLAAKWNYTPNPLAMGLLKQQTNTIGVVVPDIVTHFYSSIISGIEDIAKANGYYIVISSSQESYKKEKENLNNLLNLRVDGLIVCLAQETTDYTHYDSIIEAEIPLVFFDRVCRTEEVSSVVIDNVEAAKELTIHLYKHGARRIAHIAGPSFLNITKERIEGYRKGLQLCGLTFDQNLLVHTNMSIEGAAVATNKLLSLKYPPDAIFGVNDTVIFSAMKEIKRKGLKIPDDVALVGFTDEFHATVVEPNLTAITHPTFEIGQEAARLLLNEIKSDKARTVQQISMQAKLIERESSVKLK
ncbi:LacI family DNA-binding transcriptional regulator [Cesiribacter sp. SM1]|uniref:LacI family DNA-binding transcriptional regulator n=1 Tax=Cesiribacter sp. SM1 TaxID=2861196 RepID=UPI001CD46123|nr:LacI family DNA-binding transcriptional regulator [Cesiribacter sp. SM1]